MSVTIQGGYCGFREGPTPATGFCFETGFNDIAVPDARDNASRERQGFVKITGERVQVDAWGKSYVLIDNGTQPSGIKYL